jgi:hypothetical protein
MATFANDSSAILPASIILTGIFSLGRATTSDTITVSDTLTSTAGTYATVSDALTKPPLPKPHSSEPHAPLPHPALEITG